MQTALRFNNFNYQKRLNLTLKGHSHFTKLKLNFFLNIIAGKWAKKIKVILKNCL